MGEMNWIDITDILTEEGKRNIQTGQVMMFSKVDLKVMRKAHNGKIWAKRVFLYLPEEVDIVSKT